MKKSPLPSRPVLWFLLLFNLVVAVAAGFGLDGTQQIMTSAGMALVALGARRRPRPAPRDSGASS